MPDNIEIKARVTDTESTRALIERIADSGPEHILQTDTFFNSPEGRLKLRVFADDSGELILYHRDDTAGPKRSTYQKIPISDVAAAGKMFETLFGIRGIVRKRRALYLAGNTRIHLDRVESLGDFVELEVMLGDGDSAEMGKAVVERLMKQLGIVPTDLVDRAYIDLLFPDSGEVAENTVTIQKIVTE